MNAKPPRYLTAWVYYYLWIGMITLALIILLFIAFPAGTALSWPILTALVLTVALITATRRHVAPPPADPSLPIDQRATIDLVNASCFARNHYGFSRFHEQLQKLTPAGAIDAINTRLEKYPTDPMLLLLRAEREMLLNQFAESLDTLAKIDHPPLTPVAKWWIWAIQLAALFELDFPRAEAHCQAFANSSMPDELKVAAIDVFICTSLYHEGLPHLGAMEKWARRNLAHSPQNLSIQGTLGGVLVELGKHTEAEPNLLACLESPAPHDKAISAYYLARIRITQNNHSEARRLLEQSLIFQDLPWLRPQVQKALAQLSS